jgi:uncharacterized membrane protein YidH (DUF202 family)
MSNFPVGGFLNHLSDFLERLCSWRTLVRFSIPLFVFLATIFSLRPIKEFYGITDTTFFTSVLICGSVVSLLLISIIDRLMLQKTNNVEISRDIERSREYKPILKNLPYLAVLICIIGPFITLLIIIFDVRNDIISVQNNIADIEEQIKISTFKIVYPFNGSVIESSNFVQGSTPYPNRNIYLVVISPETGKTWIQHVPVKIFAGGLWTSYVTFDTVAPSTGKFVLRAMATKSSLPVGISAEIPKDTIFSEPVIVFRRN